MQRFLPVLAVAVLAVFAGQPAAHAVTRVQASPPASEPRAQGSSESDQDSRAVFASELNYIEVDVFATDARGDAVRGLTRDDFEVFEEGVRQEITTFAEVAIPIERVEGPPLPRDVTTNEKGIEGRIYAIVLDELHIDPRRSGLVREIARQFVQEHMAPEDVAAVVYTGARTDAGQAFTSDPWLLLQSVDRLVGRKRRSATFERLSLIEHQKDMSVPRSERPDEDPFDLERSYAARMSMQTLAQVARSFDGVHGRRKAILLFSEGSEYDTLDAMADTERRATDVSFSGRDAIATATRNNVAIYAIDPRGPVGPMGPEGIEMSAPPQDPVYDLDLQSLAREVQRSQDSLRTLAEQTGGIAAVDTNDFTTTYERIVRANSQYYLLGYHPTDFRRDGEFRRIEVRVGRPGIGVVAREGYVRPRADQKGERKLGTFTGTGTSPWVQELLGSSWPRPGLTLGVTAAAFKGSDDYASVAVTIELPGQALSFEQEDARAVNEIELSLIAIDQDGQVQGGDRLLVQPRLSAATLERVRRSGLRFVRRLDLPPGRYQLRVAAREAHQGQLGSVFYDLQVPDYGDATLAMGGILLTSRAAAPTLTPSMDDAVKGKLETPPTVARSFAADDVLTAYAEVYGALQAADDVSITTQVTDVDGREVFRARRERASPERDAAAGGMGYRVDIPLADLDPGKYLLRIEARSVAGEDAGRELSFEVRLPGAGPDSDRALTLPQPFPAVPWDARRPKSRIDRVEAWLAAVERHEPGTADEPAFTVRSWTPAELSELAADLAVIVRLIGDPGHPVLWVIDPARPGKPQRAPYSTDDEIRLRALARDAAESCGFAGDSARRCARNRILKRGAVLHTDAAIRISDEAVQPRAGSAPPQGRWRIRYNDGRQRSSEGAPGHWELARALLDNVAPDPTGDDTVRLWYLATSAHGQYHERHTRHEDRAVQLFPEDADLLLLAGSLHETFATPTIQSLLRSIRVPGVRASHGIGSERSELETAEKLFRRALKAQPALAEARVRLGRVLHLRGRHEQAARELQRAVTALSSAPATQADDVLLLAYYAEMFLGAANETLGRHGRARTSYARAAALYPGAPSPRLALSQLALRGNDRGAAQGALQQALGPPEGRRERDDPWWRYHVIQGREAGRWFEALYASLTLEP